jgi:hypothetical protein
MSNPVITVLTSQQPTAKSYSLIGGELKKKAAVHAKGIAIGMAVHTAEELADVLRGVTASPNEVLIPGFFVGSKADEPFDVVYKTELKAWLGPAGKDGLSGLWEGDKGERPRAARIKGSVEPCAWQLLDFDSPPGMPGELADLDVVGRLELLEKISPGISRCERVQCRSSSARIVKPGGVPGRASHAWVQLSDPKLLDAWRSHMRVEAPLRGVSFPVFRRSKVTGEPIGSRPVHLTLIDLAVLHAGRIVFCSAPTIGRTTMAGYSVVDAGVEIVNPGAGPLDISWARKPADARLAAYHDVTGECLDITRDGTSLVAHSYGMITLDTPIEAQDAPVVTVGEAAEWLKGQPKDTHVRCQTPFRESDSWAAFVNLDHAGKPFLYDSGTETNYWLANEIPPGLAARLRKAFAGRLGAEAGPDAAGAAPDAGEAPALDGETFGPGDISSLALKYVELPEHMDMQQLGGAFDEVPLSSEVLPNPDRTQGDKLSVKQTTTAPRVHKVMDLIGMKVRLNVMTGGIECRFGDRVLKEDDASVGIEALVHACARCGMSARGTIYDVVVLRARENRFSPVAEWIKSKPWDGRSRLGDLCETITMSAPELNAWRDLALRLWLIQTVAAIRNWEDEVPTSISHLLVLQGPKQGAHKSMWIEALLPAPWVSIGISLRLNGNERDAVSRATRTPITELGELDHSLKHSDTAALKNFLTTPKDVYRPPYARADAAKARGTSFAATLNPKEFLVDPTGERRFWPLGVRECRHEHGIDMQQLWAEVWLLEADGEVFWLIGAEQQRLHDEAVARHKAPTEEQGILDDLKYRAESCNVDAYVHASAKDLWAHYTGLGRKGSMGNYITLNSHLEAAGYRGATVQGKSGFYVPPYTSVLSLERQAQLREERRILDDLKYREQIYNVDAYVHARAKDLWEHYTGHERKGSTVNYVTLNEGLEAAGYQGGKVGGESGFYVPPYTSPLTSEQEEQRREQQAQRRNRFRAIQGGKKDG